MSSNATLEKAQRLAEKAGSVAASSSTEVARQLKGEKTGAYMNAATGIMQAVSGNTMNCVVGAGAVTGAGEVAVPFDVGAGMSFETCSLNLASSQERGPRSCSICRYNYHYGQDFGLNCGVVYGTPQYAVITGTVTSVANGVVTYKGNVGGQDVWIVHCHMPQIDVKVGDTVTKGQRVGTTGIVGIEAGGIGNAHAHIEVWPGVAPRYTNTSHDGNGSVDAGQWIRVPANVTEQGEALVNGKILADFLAALPSEPILLETRDSQLCVQAGKTEMAFNLMDVTQYPLWPDTPPVICQVDRASFVHGLTQVVPAASKDMLTNLSTVRMRFHDAQVQLTATNRYILFAVFRFFGSPSTVFTAGRQGEILGLELDRLHLDDPAPHVEYTRSLQRVSWKYGCGGTCDGKRGADCPDRHFDIPDAHDPEQVTGGLWLLTPKIIDKCPPYRAHAHHC